MSSRRNFLKSAGILSLTPAVSSANILFTETKNVPQKIKAPALKEGDTIAISSPAGAVWEESQIETFTSILKSFGFKIVLGKTLSEKHGYFAGKDDLRAKEINDFFADKNIKGIFSMKGGWGCARILDKLNYKLIQNNPKVIIGFSDITSLLVAITAKTGLVTFHGPVGNSGWNDYTKEVFVNAVMKNKAFSFPPVPGSEEPIITINSGKASGELVGGNLTVLASIIGSDYLPDWKGKILFLEDAKEEPYRVDRLLTQLKLNGILNELNGIIIGKCAKCIPEEPHKSFTLQEVLQQHLQPLKIPAFYGAMIGHIENKFTVPIGINATMNADTGEIILNENCVI